MCGRRIATYSLLLGGTLLAEPVPPPVAPPVPPPSKAEAGLEQAVDWKWSVAPSTGQEWGMPLPEALRPKDPAAAPGEAAPAPEEARPTSYTVVKGDALARIAKKFTMTVEQLKQFNELKNDRIVIGQTLKIPTPGELLAMAPPPPEEDPDAAKKEETKKKEPSMEDEDYEPMTLEQLEMETVLIQVFLDRQNFSSGPIDGKEGPTFQKVTMLYQDTHREAAGPSQLRAKALAEVKQPYTNYMLRAEDFHFIKVREIPPAAIAVNPPGTVKKKAKPKPSKPAPPALPPPLSYDEMVAADFLGYASAWEFIAERFHCDETFLRRLNDKIPDPPPVGTIFQVPNVIPFEIEKPIETPLQPAADAERPVSASIVDVSMLKIFRDQQLIAVMPIASARPGLRGRGTWTILDALPQPRLVTKHEPREAPKAVPGNTATPTPAELPPPTPEQTLAAGPNNPVGIMWIHLAKANSKEALAYGLHGTGIPAQMRSKEGIGGFRLTNWDIARAVRLLPAGTPLVWPADAVKKPVR